MRFTAHVELEDAGPFSWVNGPHLVSADEAVGWARAWARRVVVRVGERFYSAGVERVRDLPEWQPGAAEPAPPSAGREEEADRWHIETQIVWLRSDGATVARRFAEAVEAEAGVGNVAHEITESGFSLTFKLGRGSWLHAHETASRVLQAAWKATEIEATSGVDFDLPALAVHPA